MDTQELIVVRLSMSQWRPRKRDKKASAELAKLHGVANVEELGNFNKVLIDLDSIKELQRAYRALDADHKAMTAPWNDEGVRVLPARMYFDYTEMVRTHRETIDALVDEFCTVEYPKQLELAPARLNGLYNEDEYPPADTIHEKFGVNVRFEPLPDPKDVRTWGLGSGDTKQLEADLRASIEQSVQDAQGAVVKNVVKAARNFVERIRKFDEGEARSFRDTALENLRAVCDTVTEGLNITGDAELETLVNELNATIDGLTIDQLRHVETMRKDKTAEVEAILGKFAMMGGAK